ncbi:uncharacterized protein LOC142351242 isoform X1 [Convolutriloba macropyga]|uniref:uncharacterized protein LOC142351242 isoform X1 n=1 Tax=Convolutriloba macropyga TaxID=536237 RepID=UPI003F51EB68
MTADFLSPFVHQPAGIPSVPKSEMVAIGGKSTSGYHVASMSAKRPQTSVGFSRWRSWEPAMHVPRPSTNHWSKMKTEVMKYEGTQPKFLHTAPAAPSQETKVELKQEKPTKRVEVRSQEKTEVSPLPISSAPIWERGTLPSIGKQPHNVHVIKRDVPSLRRTTSARSPRVWNNSYHIRAKQGNMYWWEDPDYKHITISPHAKFGTPFGAYKTFFGLGFSPLK